MPCIPLIPTGMYTFRPKSQWFLGTWSKSQWSNSYHGCYDPRAPTCPRSGGKWATSRHTRHRSRRGYDSGTRGADDSNYYTTE
jgi:hypothetical protein